MPDRVYVVENSVDVMRVSGNDGWIGEKILQVLFPIPCEILANAPEGASGAVPNERNNQANIVLCSCGKGVIGCLKGTLVELALFRLDAERTADCVADGLSAYNLGAHLGSSVKGIINLKVTGKARSHRIVRTVPFEAKPLDVWAAI